MSGFDTLAAAKELQAAGFDQGQAEAVARTFGKFESDHLATKTDIATLRADIYRVALMVVGANAAITFGILRFLG